VKELNLERNAITGEGAMTLFEHINKYVPTITSINLWQNKLGVGSAQLKKILLFQFEKCLSDSLPDGAKALAALIIRPDSTLSHIDLNANLIGDDGVFSIAAALMSNSKSLLYLDVRPIEFDQSRSKSLIICLPVLACLQRNWR